MHVTVNGQRQEVSDNATIASILQATGLTPDRVAIELNRRLIRSEKYDTVLREGDELEVVTFVGGG